MIFFANVLPGIAFSLDLIETTGQYGLQEVLLSTVSRRLRRVLDSALTLAFHACSSWQLSSPRYSVPNHC